MDDYEHTVAKHKAWGTPHYCEICGERSVTVTREGVDVCEEHRRKVWTPDQRIYSLHTGKLL